jgi:nucleoside-diphosphate-sugar epimerase
MKVLLTGATSFTGCHIARALLDSGAQVYATLTKSKAHYQDDSLIQKRLQHAKGAEWISECAFGSDTMFSLVKMRQIDIFINHGASIKGYRSPDFNFEESAIKGLHNAAKLMACLKENGCKGLIHSGTVFEANQNLPAMSPYGLAKGKVWEGLKTECKNAKLSLSKIVIANPIGPFENDDRLIPVFARMWREGKTPSLTTPGQSWDNVPAPWLAAVYLDEAKRLMDSPAGLLRERRPSGFTISNEELVGRIAKELKGLHGKAFRFEIKDNGAQSPSRLNDEKLAELKNPDTIQNFWKSWAESLAVLP